MLKRMRLLMTVLAVSLAFGLTACGQGGEGGGGEAPPAQPSN